MLPPGQFEIDRLKVLNISTIPEIDINNYSLKITGLVKKPMKLSYKDLQNLNQIELEIPAHCVEGWSVLNLRWEGVDAKEIIKLTSPENSKFVVLKSMDGYSTSVPFDYFQKGILALKLNGETIPHEHGFPVRAVIPDLYFWKSAKWLCEIEFVAEYKHGFWEKRGYHEIGDVWLEQRRK